MDWVLVPRWDSGVGNMLCAQQWQSARLLQSFRDAGAQYSWKVRKQIGHLITCVLLGRKEEEEEEIGRSRKRWSHGGGGKRGVGKLCPVGGCQSSVIIACLFGYFYYSVLELTPEEGLFWFFIQFFNGLCLSVCLSVCLSLSLPVSLSVTLFVSLSLSCQAVVDLFGLMVLRHGLGIFRLEWVFGLCAFSLSIGSLDVVCCRYGWVPITNEYLSELSCVTEQRFVISLFSSAAPPLILARGSGTLRKI